MRQFPLGLDRPVMFHESRFRNDVDQRPDNCQRSVADRIMTKPSTLRRFEFCGKLPARYNAIVGTLLTPAVIIRDMSMPLIDKPCKTADLRL